MDKPIDKLSSEAKKAIKNELRSQVKEAFEIIRDGHFFICKDKSIGRKLMEISDASLIKNQI